MSPYYDQPGLRQRGPEDVAGVLVTQVRGQRSEFLSKTIGGFRPAD